VVTSQPLGIPEFVSSVWQDGEVFVDEAETFKKALGGQKYKNRWLLSPAVIRRIFASMGFGSFTGDLNEKSTMLGGAMIVGRQGVLFSQTETSGFVYPKADVLLAALDSATDSAACVPETQSTAAAVTD